MTGFALPFVAAGFAFAATSAFLAAFLIFGEAVLTPAFALVFIFFFESNSLMNFPEKR
ncbi:MAG: hypothetical protein IPJ07_12410 [Acidobacteria bacterium]|nr:hypothetical protein [Acidobacteriota bacterium]